MPYPPEHKAKTRARIVESARRLFNRRGFADVTIDEIMSSAGLTRGGFYNHFKTKDALYGEAVASYAGRNPAESWDDVELDFGAPARTVVRQLVEAYLSRQHLEDVDHHCPMIALPSDVARGGPIVRAAYQQLLETMVEVIESGLDPDDDRRREKALSMAVLCVGGMVITRTVDDERLREDLRDAARRLALAVGGYGGPDRGTE